MVIFFTKEYFFLFNHFDHDLKDDNGYFLGVRDQLKA